MTFIDRLRGRVSWWSNNVRASTRRGYAARSALGWYPLFETEKANFPTPNLSPFSRLNGKDCFLRCLGQAFLRGLREWRCHFFGLVAYLRPQKAALGVALSAPPSVCTDGVVWFKPRHAFPRSSSLKLLPARQSHFATRRRCTARTL